MRPRSGACTRRTPRVAELNYPPCHIRMTLPRLGNALFEGDSIRAQRPLFLLGSHAPRRGRALLSRLAIRRRPGRRCSCIAASANRGRGLREGGEGVEGVEGIEQTSGVEAEAPSTSPLEHLDSVEPVDPRDPTRSRYRPGRVAPASATHRTRSREANNRRPRLPRSLRFPRGFSARQRGRSGDGKRPRSLRDVFGHTASISRRRTS